MFHGLSADRRETVQRLHGLDAFERARADGRIRHVGFSFHGSPDSFTTIVDGYDWDFCQIQYNFMDEEFEAGPPGCGAPRSAASAWSSWNRCAGVAGGRVPEPIAAIWVSSPVKRTPVDWGLRWVWNRPEVVMVLTGMNMPEQLDENLATAESARTVRVHGRRSWRSLPRLREFTGRRSDGHLHHLRLLPAVPRGRCDSRRVLELQHQRDVRRAPDGVICLSYVGHGRGARRRPVHALRRMRAEMPATDSDPGHARGGAHSSDAPLSFDRPPPAAQPATLRRPAEIHVPCVWVCGGGPAPGTASHKERSVNRRARCLRSCVVMHPDHHRPPVNGFSRSEQAGSGFLQRSPPCQQSNSVRFRAGFREYG